MGKSQSPATSGRLTLEAAVYQHKHGFSKESPNRLSVVCHVLMKMCCWHAADGRREKEFILKWEEIGSCLKGDVTVPPRNSESSTHFMRMGGQERKEKSGECVWQEACRNFGKLIK